MLYIFPSASTEKSIGHFLCCFATKNPMASGDITVIQTSRGKVCVAKLGSGEATARYVPDRRSLFAFCAKLRLWDKQKAKHLLKSRVMPPDAIGFLVEKQHKKCPIDFSVLALGKI